MSEQGGPLHIVTDGNPPSAGDVPTFDGEAWRPGAVGGSAASLSRLSAQYTGGVGGVGETASGAAMTIPWLTVNEVVGTDIAIDGDDPTLVNITEEGVYAVAASGYVKSWAGGEKINQVFGSVSIGLSSWPPDVGGTDVEAPADGALFTAYLAKMGGTGYIPADSVLSFAVAAVTTDNSTVTIDTYTFLAIQRLV